MGGDGSDEFVVLDWLLLLFQVGGAFGIALTSEATGLFVWERRGVEESSLSPGGGGSDGSSDEEMGLTPRIISQSFLVD